MEKDLWTETVTLEGQRLRLEPAGEKHLDDLEKHLISPTAWHTIHWQIKDRASLEKLFTRRAVMARAQGLGNCFVMVEKASGLAIGISNLMNFNRPARGLEIGGTWIGEKWHRTFVNTEAKLLMLGFAFEKLGLQRVEFRVDSLNMNSQKAVLRIGAKYEGELRQANLLPDGRKQNAKVYSIIDSEWPAVKEKLLGFLQRY